MKGDLTKMYTMLTWDEMCLVHAIVNVGTLSGAARVLDVSHPTAFRRLNKLEEKMEVRFFNRARDGYAATAAAEEVSALVRRLRSEILAAERRIAGRDLRPSGTLRITTTDTLLFGWLSPSLRSSVLHTPKSNLSWWFQTMSSASPNEKPTSLCGLPRSRMRLLFVEKSEPLHKRSIWRRSWP